MKQERLTKKLNDMKKPIYTVSVYNMIDEEDITTMPLLVPYYNLDDACRSAVNQAELISDADDVVEVRVMAGEYENEKGEIWGEPEVVFVASNSSRERTMEVRKKLGYCSLEVDYYSRIH